MTTEQIFFYTLEQVKQFKSVTGNRNIRDMSHIYDITVAMLDGNYIPPVVISKEGYLLDGQHRANAFIRACAQSTEPLTLRVIVDPSEGTPLELAIKYNSNRKNWGTQDYMNAYVTDYRKSYMRLKEFMDRHNLDIKAAVQLIKGSHSTETFKAGALNITSMELRLAEGRMKVLKYLSQSDVLGHIAVRRDVIMGFYHVYDKISDFDTFLDNVINNKGKAPQTERSTEWKTFYLSNI